MNQSKSNQSFSFPYPLKHKIVRDLKIVTVTEGVLQIEAIGHEDKSVSKLDVFDRYAVDIESIKFNGTDVRPVLEVMGGLEEIHEAALRYFANKVEGGIAA